MNLPAASTSMYKWVRLDPARLGLRLVAARFASGAERLTFGGQDEMSAQEVDALMRLGFYHSRGGMVMRDGVRFTLQELRSVFPTAVVADMPKELISRLYPRRASAQDPAGVPLTQAALHESNLVAGASELGTNADGETVWQGEDGRFTTRERQVTARERDAGASADPARFLMARTPRDLARCADGFVAEILRGRPQRFTDLKRWCGVVNDLPVGAIETSPRLREWQEAVEAAIVRCMGTHAKANAAAFEFARRLEDGQPAFQARTSSSINNQQYSTPMPISVAVQCILGDQAGATVLEPTIGNGSLVTLIRDARVSGVDIDDRRVASIRRDRPDIAVEQGDFLSLPIRAPSADGKFDTIVANPPFGGLARPVMMDGLKVGRIDYQVLMRSLQLRTDVGLGVYIVGADSTIDSRAGQVSGGSRHLFNWLSDHYQVDVVEVDGGLYAKQGAAFPIRIVVVGPKGKNPVEISDQLPVIEDHQSLLSWSLAMQKKYASVAAAHRNDVMFDAAALPPAQDADGSVEDLTFDAMLLDLPLAEAAPDAAASPNVADLEAPAAVDAAPTAALVEDNSYQSPYVAKSRIGEASSMIPRNLQTATLHALDAVEAAHGDIDAFVARSLGWSVTEMQEHGYLSPEQVDAVALAIHAQGQDRACLEGDQTGLGKGRVMAAMARYNALNGRATVFLTETPTLFTDFWRDLQDIGSEKLFKPMIVNASVPVYDPKTGTTLVPATSRAEFNRALALDAIPPEYNLVLATYSQFNRAPDVSAKARWIGGATRGAQLLLDEAHNAAGDSNTGRNIATAIENAAGVAYSSATSMKGAKNVLIYSALFPESVDVGGLPETLQAGGEVLQEVLSGMMARDGVFVRREHDLSALTFETVEDAGRKQRNIDIADRLAEILELMNFVAGDIDGLVNERNKELKELLARLPEEERKGSRMGAISMNFGSRLFAIYRQFQMAVKTELAAERCLLALEQGKKPVVVLENTMESLLRELVYENRDDLGIEGLEDLAPTGANLAAGVELGAGLTFRDVLNRMVERLMYYNEVTRYGEVEKRPIESKETLQVIANIRGLIAEFPDLPASPLDEIRRRMEAAGYAMAELSGRSLQIEERADPVTGLMTAVATARPEQPKAKIVREFNAGLTDALLLTRAGSTGISLHASKTFDDQRQRVLIELQSAQDVNVRVQFFGRVNRKGQVSAPEIETLSSGLIGEARPIAMQNAKLRRLSANTTANQDTAALDRNVPDFINHIGDLVARRYLEANPAIAHRLQINMDLEEAESGYGQQEAYFITKLTSRLVMLRNAEQEAIYDEITSEYRRILRELDEKGQNPFKSKDLDLRAITLGHEVFEGGNPASGSVFEFPVYLKTIQYEEEIHPLRADEVKTRCEGTRQRYEQAYGQPIDTALTRMVAMIERGREPLLRQAMQGRKDTLEQALSEKEPNAVNRLNQRVDFIVKGLREIRPGAVVTVTGMEEAKLTGVVIDFTLPDNEKKFHNAGQYTVLIAVPGLAKPVERSLYALMEDPAYQVRSMGAYGMKLWEDFDGAPSGMVKRQRCVLDGNLFKAAQIAAAAKLGSCVMYTDEQGARHRGVMLHAGVQPKHLKGLTVRIETPAIAAALMDAMPDLVLSTNSMGVDREGGATVERDGALYKMTVPGTKSGGGRFFANTVLCDITGEFSGTRAFMTARFAPEKLEAVVKSLAGMGVSLYAPAECRAAINEILVAKHGYTNENGEEAAPSQAA